METKARREEIDRGGTVLSSKVFEGGCVPGDEKMFSFWMSDRVLYHL